MSDNRLRLEQWKNEPMDIFVLRALGRALPRIDDTCARYALWHYLWRRAEAELLKMQGGSLSGDTSGQ